MLYTPNKVLSASKKTIYSVHYVHFNLVQFITLLSFRVKCIGSRRGSSDAGLKYAGVVQWQND